MTQTTTVDALAHLASEMTEAAVIGQATGLRLLLAEMQALTQVLPGRAAFEPAQATTEADFDNMPV